MFTESKNRIVLKSFYAVCHTEYYKILNQIARQFPMLLKRYIFILYLLALFSSIGVNAQVTVSTRYLTNNPEREIAVDVLATSEGDIPATLVLYLFITEEPKQGTDTSSGDLPQGLTPVAELSESQNVHGVQMDTEYYPPEEEADDLGVFVVALYHPAGKSLLIPEVLFTLRFPSLSGRTFLPALHIVEENAPIHLKGQYRYSTAAAATLDQIEVYGTPCTVPPVCRAPEPPATVQASQRQRRRISVHWQAPDFEGVLEYRIYRSVVPDIAMAVPAGDSWFSDPAYLDQAPETCVLSSDTEETPGRKIVYRAIRLTQVPTICSVSIGVTFVRIEY